MADGTRSIDDIANRLRTLQSALDLTQVGFAELVDITQPALNNYLQGVRRPRIDEAIKISAKTGVTLDWIYQGERAGLPARLLAILPDQSSAERRRAKA